MRCLQRKRLHQIHEVGSMYTKVQTLASPVIRASASHGMYWCEVLINYALTFINWLWWLFTRLTCNGRHFSVSYSMMTWTRTCPKTCVHLHLVLWLLPRGHFWSVKRTVDIRTVSSWRRRGTFCLQGSRIERNLHPFRLPVSQPSNRKENASLFLFKRIHTNCRGDKTTYTHKTV